MDKTKLVEAQRRNMRHPLSSHKNCRCFNNGGWFDRQKEALHQLLDKVIANSDKQKEGDCTE